MIVLFGSILALAASIFIYFKSKRENFSLIMSDIVYELTFNGYWASKELVKDIVFAYNNKTDLPDKSNKVAIVTGGSRGIGTYVVQKLLQCNMEVLLTCREVETGERALKQIRESGVTSGVAKVYALNNLSLQSVRQFADQVKRKYKKIDLLVNNAGIMMTPYGLSEEGFEQQWGVNYLSHFLLTSLLLPLLKAGGTPESPARIVNVSSCAHLAGSINFDDISFKKHFNSTRAYNQSKLAQAMFTKTLQEHFEEKKLPIMAFSVHPGIVNTDLFEHTYIKRYLSWVMQIFFKTPEQGARSIVHAAVSDKLKDKGGIYIANCQEDSVNPLVLDRAQRSKVFKISLEQTQLEEFL